MKRSLSLLLALIITVAALIYALWGVDFAELTAVLVQGSYATLAPYVLGLAVFYWLKALRWTVILAPFGAFTWREVAPSMMIGFAASNVLPGHLGELVRSWLFSRQTSVPLSSVLVSIMLERILDVVGILLFYLAAIAVMDAPPEGLRIGAWVVALLLGLAWSGILLALLRPAWLFKVYDRATGRLGGGIKARGRQLLDNSVRALGALQSMGQVLQLIAYTLVKWALLGALIWLAVWAYGETVSLGVARVVLAVSTLAVTVPSAPGYVGAIQAAFVFALVPFGVLREVALAASVFFLVGHWVPVTLAGAGLLLWKGARLSEIRGELSKLREAEQQPGPAG